MLNNYPSTGRDYVSTGGEVREVTVREGEVGARHESDLVDRTRRAVYDEHGHRWVIVEREVNA